LLKPEYLALKKEIGYQQEEVRMYKITAIKHTFAQTDRKGKKWQTQ